MHIKKNERKLNCCGNTVKFIWVLLLVFLGLLATCKEGDNPQAKAHSKITPPQMFTLGSIAPISASDPLDNKFKIPTGPFLFGASETQFQLYLRRSRVNFPGMEDRLRKLFVIPQRSVSLPEFHIDQFEVTNRQYADFLLDTKYRPTNTIDYLNHWSEETIYPEWASTFPLVWVAQEDAQAYCEWSGGRLPSEEEWEKAARGTEGAYFPWGNIVPTPEQANFNTDQVEPAGNRPADKSPYEIYDMGGNVAELTSTVIKDNGEIKVVVRGGSFLGRLREMLVYQRTQRLLRGERRANVGFRCLTNVATGS